MNPKNVVLQTGTTGPRSLAEGYRQMAADIEREMEANEWTEALAGDILKAVSGSISGSKGCRSAS